MTNPFVFEVYATGEHFCGRSRELAKIKQLVSDGNNVLLYSRRRYGKSSLIKELFDSHLPRRRFLPIFVDLFEILDAYDFARLFYQSAATAMGFSTASAMKQLVRYFSKANFSLSVGNDGAPRLTPTLGSRDFDELVKDAFEGVEAYGKEKKRIVVVAFDEFQQIAEVTDKRLDAIIRKHMQVSRHSSFIFCGSKRHLLTSLFNDQKKPLYQMATGVSLGGIAEDVFYAFVNKKLGSRLSRDGFTFLYDVTQGESKLIQQAGYHLYYEPADRIGVEQVATVLERIVSEADAEYRMLFDRLPRGQKHALRAIVSWNGVQLFAKHALQDLDVSKQTLSTSLKALQRDELVDREGERYAVIDRKFDLWLRRLFRASES